MYKKDTESHLISVSSAITPETFKAFGELIQNPTTHGEDGSRLQHVNANQGSATKWLDVTYLDNHYHLAPSRKPAKAVMNMFVCKPRTLDSRNGKPVFPVRILERHPYTPQTFIPLGVNARDSGTRYLVIVAPTLGAGELLRPYPGPESRPKKSLRERLLGLRPAPYSNSLTGPLASSSALADRRPKGPGEPDLGKIQAFIVRGDQAVTYGPGTWHAPMVVLGERAIDFCVVQHANGVAQEDCQEIEITATDGGEGPAVVIDDRSSFEDPSAPGIMRAKL